MEPHSPLTDLLNQQGDREEGAVNPSFDCTVARSCLVVNIDSTVPMAFESIDNSILDKAHG